MDGRDSRQARRVGRGTAVREGGVRAPAPAGRARERRAAPGDGGDHGARRPRNRVRGLKPRVAPGAIRDYLSAEMTAPTDDSAPPSPTGPKRSKAEKDSAAALKAWVVLARAYLAISRHVTADVARYDLTA